MLFSLSHEKTMNNSLKIKLTCLGLHILHVTRQYHFCNWKKWDFPLACGHKWSKTTLLIAFCIKILVCIWKRRTDPCRGSQFYVFRSKIFARVHFINTCKNIKTENTRTSGRQNRIWHRTRTMEVKLTLACLSNSISFWERFFWASMSLLYSYIVLSL